MFERFTQEARQVVVLAQEEARRLHHDYLGTEHLLLGFLMGTSGPAARALEQLDIGLEIIRADVVRVIGEGLGPTDAEALGRIGIDLSEVRRRAEDAFGPGALDLPAARRRTWRRNRCESPGIGAGRIPFTPMAKKALELAVREARALGSTDLAAEHLLLAISRKGCGLAAEILAMHGATERRVRSAVLIELQGEDGFPGVSA